METQTPKTASLESAESINGIQPISTFRRVLPQILASMAKNFIIVNLGQFASFPSIVIPSLVGVSKALNPDETLHITAAQSSWLSSFAHIAHPIGSLVSGPVCDRIGRRKTIMLVSLPLIISWVMLGFAHSFPIICTGFLILGFCFGLKESPSLTYVGEISETMIRGMLLTISLIAGSLGIFITLGFGSILSWRQVSFICTLSPILCLIAVLFVPESPSWLLSKDRRKDAQTSLKWLRGWVSTQTIHQEFSELQNYSDSANACGACAKESIKCYHPKPTFCDKLKELRRKRILKPCILIFCIQFFSEFSGINAWQPYIIQVLNAIGTPINPNLVTVIGSIIYMMASLFLLLAVKKVGRRKLYLTSLLMISLCFVGLSVYGFVFFPPGWKSFKESSLNHTADFQYIRQNVGSCGYLALGFIFIAQFATKILGIGIFFNGEVLPFKMRSFLCGISSANQYILAAIAAKTYYNIEMWLSLSGATLFYGGISAIGFTVMYFILPETEQRSLEDIERHYSDNSKGLFDIHIHKKSTNEE